jgi:ABC-2 type transport system ATP-binding protein
VEVTPSVVRVRGLVKAFGHLRVLDGIDLDVRAGEVFGYLGPNGAGKSTTVKVLAGMLTPFAGEAYVCGVDVRADPIEVKRRVGYVPENARLYDVLTAREYLGLIGGLHHLPQAVLRARVEGLMEAFELSARLDTRLGALSKGMRQKVLISGGLLHDPRLLFLDEPLAGLDVSSTLMVKELLRALADRGRTIFYCSHVMDVVERVCDRIVILADGKIVADGSFEELAARSGEAHLESIFAELTGSDDGQERAARVLEVLES